LNKLNIMNKTELVNEMAQRAGISKNQAQEALNCFIDCTQSTLKGGDKLTLVGFGTFSVSHRAARQGRNPQTGATIQIAAKNVVKFKPGSELSNSVA